MVGFTVETSHFICATSLFLIVMRLLIIPDGWARIFYHLDVIWYISGIFRASWRARVIRHTMRYCIITERLLHRFCSCTNIIYGICLQIILLSCFSKCEKVPIFKRGSRNLRGILQKYFSIYGRPTKFFDFALWKINVS